MRIEAAIFLNLLVLSGIRESCSWTWAWGWTEAWTSHSPSREQTSVASSGTSEQQTPTHDTGSVPWWLITSAQLDRLSTATERPTTRTQSWWLISTTEDIRRETTSDTTRGVTGAAMTTTTTTPPLTTTPSSVPKLSPAPYVLATLTTAMNASDVISAACSNNIASDFRTSFQDVVSRMNAAIASGRLCTGNGGAMTVMPGQIKNFFMGNQVQTEFSLLVGTNPVDSVTVGLDESCSWDASQFAQNMSNWRQPVISNIFGCPIVDITPPGFTWSTSQWGCF